MSDSLDDFLGELGVDYSDARDRLARDLVQADRSLLIDLINARILANMSKSDVAEAMGRHRSVVTNFEKLTSDPHLSTIRRYAAAVGAYVRHTVEPTRPSTYRVIRRETLAPSARQVFGPHEAALESARKRIDVAVAQSDFQAFLTWGHSTPTAPLSSESDDWDSPKCLM